MVEQRALTEVPAGVGYGGSIQKPACQIGPACMHGKGSQGTEQISKYWKTGELFWSRAPTPVEKKSSEPNLEQQKELDFRALDRSNIHCVLLRLAFDTSPSRRGRTFSPTGVSTTSFLSCAVVGHSCIIWMRQGKPEQVPAPLDEAIGRLY
jgi:hypothetical protein